MWLWRVWDTEMFVWRLLSWLHLLVNSSLSSYKQDSAEYETTLRSAHGSKLSSKWCEKAVASFFCWSHLTSDCAVAMVTCSLVKGGQTWTLPHSQSGGRVFHLKVLARIFHLLVNNMTESGQIKLLIHQQENEFSGLTGSFKPFMYICKISISWPQQEQMIQVFKLSPCVSFTWGVCEVAMVTWGKTLTKF